MCCFGRRAKWVIGALLTVALLAWLPGPAARGSAVVFVDQGLSRPGLRWISTASWLRNSVAVASDRAVYRRSGARSWHRVASFTPQGADAAVSADPVVGLAWSRRGLIVGLQRGLVVLGARGRRRVLLSGLPARALAVGPAGRRIWVGQGRWIWRTGRRGWERIGRSPGGAFRMLAPHPRLRSTLLGSDGRAVYRSADGGRSWRRVRLGAAARQVRSVGFSMRSGRGTAAALMILTRRALLRRRSGRLRTWPGPPAPRRVLGARRSGDADWVLGDGLYRAVGRSVRFQRISLGLGGGRVLDVAADRKWRRGVWCITSNGVYRLKRKQVRRRLTRGCPRWPAIRSEPRPRLRRADWLPRLSIRVVGTTRLGDRWTARRAGSWRGSAHRWGLAGLVSLDWPLNLSGTTVAMSRGLSSLARSRWRRQERWKRIRLARCRNRRLRLSPADALWVERETTEALVRWAQGKKE